MFNNKLELHLPWSRPHDVTSAGHLNPGIGIIFLFLKKGMCEGCNLDVRGYHHDPDHPPDHHPHVICPLL